jgi:hypothetical protein
MIASVDTQLQHSEEYTNTLKMIASVDTQLQHSEEYINSSLVQHGCPHSENKALAVSATYAQKYAATLCKY